MIKNSIEFRGDKIFVNGIEFDANFTVKSFNNFAEVGEWWSANPTAVRVAPDTNKNVSFPCSMKFAFPLNSAA